MLIRGLDGCVLVPPPVAAFLAPLLRSELYRLTTVDRIDLPPAVTDVVDELIEAGKRWRSVDQPVDQPVDELDGGPLTSRTIDSDGVGHAPPNPCDELVSLPGAASLLRLTRQALWGRCQRGTLPFTRDERGRYWIRKDDIAP